MNLPFDQLPITPPAGRRPPTVWLVGQSEHSDFHDAVDLLRREAKIDPADDCPELIVALQDRPGAIAQREVEALQRRAPLAGVVAIVGSWCEGELRTGRPLAGVVRLYWYEFSAWWRRQRGRREQGLCPEWVVPEDFGLRHPEGTPDCGLGMNTCNKGGNVILSVPFWDTAEALADVLRSAEYTAVWQPKSRPFATDGSRVVAGIWEGGQLDRREAENLAAFCQLIDREAAPVIALLDFPRRDCVDAATAAGAAAVLGKPWRNVDVVETLEFAIQRRSKMPEEIQPARAA